MSKATRKTDLAQVRKQLAILKRKGLYKPKNAKGKPTRYAMRQLKKYADVVAERADILKAPPAAIAQARRDNLRTVRGKIVVRKQTGVIHKLDRQGNVVSLTRIGDTHKFTSRKARIINGKPETLQPGQFYELPVRHGRDLVYTRIDSLDEIMDLIDEYSEGKDGKAGFDALKYLNIATLERGGKWRVVFLDPETRRKRRRTVRGSNEDEARGLFRATYPEYATAIILNITAL